MFASDIGLAGAFFGGLFSLISPCAALLLPSFFAYAFTSRRQLVARTALFYLGLAAILVPLGAGVGALGSLLTQHRTTVTMVGGIVIVALGIVIIVGGGFQLPHIAQWLARLRIDGILSVILLGALYGLAGFCAGPLLGAVLTVAAAGGSPTYGGFLMGIYALGMAAPLLVLALVWDHWKLSERSWLRGRHWQWGPVRVHSTSLIGGLVFIAIGVLFVSTAGTASLGGIVSTHTEFELQTWILGLADTITDLHVLLIVAVIVLLVLLVRMWLRTRQGAAVSSRASDDD